MFRPGLGLLVLVVLTMPVASAQQPSTAPPAELTVKEDLQLPNGRLLPETGEARVRVALSIGCGFPPSTKDAVVRFTVKSTASYASAIALPLEATYKLVPERCVQENYREVVEAEVIVTTMRDAPAMAKFPTTVAATIHDENGEYGPYEAEFILRNDFIPLTMLSPAQLYIKAAPGTKVVFPVEAQNLGNGPVLVTSEAMQPNKNKLPSVNPGSEFHLDSRAQKGAAAVYKRTFNVEAVTPTSSGYMNAIYQFNVRFVSTYDGDAPGQLMTDEQTIAFAVQVQGGLGGGAPAVSPLALLGALVVLALLFRRRAP